MLVHAWSLPREIAPEQWRELHARAVDVLVAASAELERTRVSAPAAGTEENLVLLRGPAGLGPLVIEPERIAFNGNAFLGQSADPFAIERKAMTGVIRNAAVGDRVFRRCDTQRLPYDLAVCGVLLVAKRVLGDAARVGSEGSLRGSAWRGAASLVRRVLATDDELTQDERGFLRWVPAERRLSEPSRSSA